jgi:putative colanic acid biosynthesis UDP-glucose lipid carrier transferase
MSFSSRNTIILKLLVQISDLLILNLLYLGFYFIFKEHPIMVYSLSYWIIGNVAYLLSLNIVTVVLHNRITQPETIISRVVQTLLFHALVFLAGLSLCHIPSPSILLLGVFYVCAFGFTTTERLLLRKEIKRLRSYGRDSRMVVLIGEGQTLMEIAGKMSDAESGYKLLGVFSDEELNGFPPTVHRKGKVEQAILWLSFHKVHEVYCGLPSKRSKDILEIINYCENNLIHFYSVPGLQNYVQREVSPVKFDDILVIGIREEPLNFFGNRIIKRSFDLVISSLFLGIVYPWMYLIVGIIVKISSPGPVYFRQERTGIDGKTFWCLKFRSMKENGDCDTLQATKDDPRKTKIGDFLRRTSLDEFPQFINVWKGEMSIVGPRPHMLKHTEEYSRLINQYMVRHWVKPGITGWAQVNGCRGETKQLSEMQDRVKHDIWYLEHWTFWLDVRITFQTIANLFQAEKNAY